MVMSIEGFKFPTTRLVLSSSGRAFGRGLSKPQLVGVVGVGHRFVSFHGFSYHPAFVPAPVPALLPGLGPVPVRARRFRAPFRNPRHGDLSPAQAIACILGAVQSDCLNSNLVKTLDRQAQFLSLNDWFTVLEEISNSRRWLSVLEVFRWMQQQKWYTPDDGFYAKLITILGKKGRLRLARWFFAEMKRNGYKPNTSVMNSVIAAHLRSENKPKALAAALSYLEEMKQKKRCEPNVVTYNILLRAYAQADMPHEINLLLMEMEKNGIPSNVSTFNGILDVYGKAGKLFEMEDMLIKMRESKHKPDVISFNILIDSYGKVGNFTKMERALESMFKANLKPQLSTFNSIIKNYGRVGNVERMEWGFEKMVNESVKPDLVTYETLMSGYGSVGCFDKVRECFEEMEDVGIKSQVSTLNLLLNLHCSHGLVKEADAILHNSQEIFGLKPNNSSYLILIKACADGHHPELLENLMLKMELSGVKLQKKMFLEVLRNYVQESMASPIMESEANYVQESMASPIMESEALTVGCNSI